MAAADLLLLGRICLLPAVLLLSVFLCKGLVDDDGPTLLS